MLSDERVLKIDEAKKGKKKKKERTGKAQVRIRCGSALSELGSESLGVVVSCIHTS